MMSAMKSPNQSLVWIVCWILAMTTGFVPTVQSAESLITFDTAARQGLHRAWFAQIDVDRARNRVANWTLHQGHLFALTTAGTIHALDAETGETRWVARVGSPNRSTVGPAVNDSYLAVINGSRLHVLDIQDGHLIWSRAVGGAPAAAPALSKNYAYVALLTGRMEGYRLDDPLAKAWYYQSAGRIFQPPTATGQVVSWSTEWGYLYASLAETPGVLFRMETGDEIVAAPAEKGSYLYVASLNGYLYCIEGMIGSQRWRYSTGFPIISPPAIIGEKAFVASEAPALHALNTATGYSLWTTSGISQFVAQGSKHAYGMDQRGSLLILDNETGQIVGRIATGDNTRAIVNDQTDRIFLVSNRGLVQCLREMDATEPILYRKPASEENTPDEKAGAEETPAEEKPAEDKAEPTTTDEDDSSFEPNNAADEDNPFGDFNPFE